MSDYLKELFIEEAKKALESRKAGGITPTGDINITENGEFDITEFAKAIVNVAGGGGDEASMLDSLIDGSITEITHNAKSIKTYAFYSCSNLTAVNFPLATSIGSNAFDSCSYLTAVNFPLVTSIGSFAFDSCSRLTTVKFPLPTSIGSNAFDGCARLTTADFTPTSSIGTKTFYQCYSLKALILRSVTMRSLSNINAFASCSHIYGTVITGFNPDGLKDGYIYVPRALVEDYKSATNWSTFASQFRALEDYTVDGTITGELDESKI